MDPSYSFLVYIYYEHDKSLLKVAVKSDKDWLSYDLYPFGSYEAIHAALPMHIRSCGPVIAIEPLFDSVVI